MSNYPTKKYFLLLCCLLSTYQCLAQTPFTCRGNFFLSFASQSESAVYESQIDPITNMASYNILPAPPMDFLLNAIGYRSTDDLIYGLKSVFTNEDLVIIDATGTSYSLTTLFGLKNELKYPAGDITPDGKYLVVMGAQQLGGGGFTEDISLIDLESTDYEVTNIEPESNTLTCADIAFDPTTGTLYGFDNESRSLVIINYLDGTFQTNFPTSNVAEYIGALFFDVSGNLFGYGIPNSGNNQNTLFEINKTTGEFTILEEGPLVQRSDGCSCPYPVEMKKSVAPEVTIPCTPITFTIDIINATSELQPNLTFEDQLPAGMTILDVTTSFGGNITSGIGSNLLLIENIDLPPDSSLITIIAEASNNVNGLLENQATLNGLSSFLGTIVISDDPTTDATIDATQFIIDPFVINLDDIPTSICEGDTILIDPKTPWEVDFIWSDNSTDSLLAITESGNYSVTISSGCESIVRNFEILQYDLTSSLPEVSQLLLGDSMTLNPMVTFNPDIQFDWVGTNDNDFCNDCPKPIVSPEVSTFYFLRIFTASGCEAFDTTLVRVIEETDNIYMPTVFSPNDDGFNDIFYPQSRVDEKVLTFKIFSRWGELLFEKNNVITNDRSIGWDGYFLRKKTSSGVYVYFLEIEREDGSIEKIIGDITLLNQ